MHEAICNMRHATGIGQEAIGNMQDARGYMQEETGALCKRRIRQHVRGNSHIQYIIGNRQEATCNIH